MLVPIAQAAWQGASLPRARRGGSDGI